MVCVALRDFVLTQRRQAGRRGGTTTPTRPNRRLAVPSPHAPVQDNLADARAARRAHSGNSCVQQVPYQPAGNAHPTQSAPLSCTNRNARTRGRLDVGLVWDAWAVGQSHTNRHAICCCRHTVLHERTGPTKGRCGHKKSPREFSVRKKPRRPSYRLAPTRTLQPAGRQRSCPEQPQVGRSSSTGRQTSGLPLAGRGALS